MSAEKYSSYTDAFREFRMNISENDFHDDYPETPEMTLAIASGLRYHYIREYRSMSADQSIQLIETFAKRCAKLEQYTHKLNECLYSPEYVITHEHWSDSSNPGFNEWLLLCYAYGLITLTYEQQRNICWGLAYRNAWVKRNTIQLKAIDKDIKRRIEIQQKLNDMGKLVNDISEFNRIYKHTNIPSIDLRTGIRSCKYIIDFCYDGHIDERLGTDTIYEWILNDDVDRFQQWYNDRGLHEYNNVPRGKDKNIKYRKNIAAHILASKAIKIIRYIIMNHIPEFLDEIHGMWALMDPWRYPVNDPECFRILQERFRLIHEQTVRLYLENDMSNTGVLPEHVYRFIKPEIAMAIFNEMIEIFTQLTGESNICFSLFVAISFAKYGHIEPVESLDWNDISKRLSIVNGYTYKQSFYPQEWIPLFWSRDAILSDGPYNMPFGMNPATAVYLHDLFAENDAIKIQLDKQLIDSIKDTVNDYHLYIPEDGYITMAGFEEEELMCTDDELYR